MAELTLHIGESRTVQLYSEQTTANGTGIGALTDAVEWTTDDELIATVTPGQVMSQGGSGSSAATITAVWLGATTITATSSTGKVDTITVHVVEDNPGTVVRLGVVS